MENIGKKFCFGNNSHLEKKTLIKITAKIFLCDGKWKSKPLKEHRSSVRTQSVRQINLLIMTIKNCLQSTSQQSVNLNTSTSDMQKRGAVKNLFGTTVDRDELQKNLRKMEMEELRKLRSYEVMSVIGVIDSASEDQTRKHKRFPRYLESSEDDSEEEHQRCTPPREPISSDNASSPPSTSSQTVTLPSKKAALNTVRKSRRSKGQQTIKGTEMIKSCQVLFPAMFFFSSRFELLRDAKVHITFLEST